MQPSCLRTRKMCGRSHSRPRRTAAFRRRAAFLYPVAPCFRRRHSAAPQNMLRTATSLGAVSGPDGAAIITELRNYSGVKVMSANFETATLDSRASVVFHHAVRTLVRIIALECSSPSGVPRVITCRNERKSGRPSSLYAVVWQPGLDARRRCIVVGSSTPSGAVAVCLPTARRQALERFVQHPRSLSTEDAVGPPTSVSTS